MNIPIKLTPNNFDLEEENKIPKNDDNFKMIYFIKSKNENNFGSNFRNPNIINQDNPGTNLNNRNFNNCGINTNNNRRRYNPRISR